MKIRTDFVTNSSSSSFVIDLTVENASGEKCTLASFYKDYCDEGYSARRTIGPKTLSGQCGHNDPDTSFDPEGWWTVFDDLTGEESSALDGYSDEDYDLLDILGNKDVRDVERVLNKMISGTAITDADENAIKSLIERALETNNISLKEIDIYCIGEELELSGDFDMMEPSDFLGWDDALKSSNADIEMLARRYKTDVESMRIFLDMRGHTYLTRRENVKNVRTGETFLRHIIYPSIYKDSRDTDPLPIPFYNDPSSSNETSGVTDDTSAGFEDFEVSGNVLVKYLGKFAKSVTIPLELGIKTIGERAFAENEEITSVTIPEGVEVIAKEAFYFARNIEEIILPSTLKRIGNSAFCGCGALEKIELPEGVKEIADGAFSFTGLTTLNIPKSLTRLGGKDPEDLTASGVLSNSKIKHFEFPSGWTEVPDNMFSFCQELISVILPDTITHIGNSAFSYCTSLASIDLPSNLKVVGHSAFSRTAIEIIELPASVIEIGDRCFEESNLKELSLPDSVTVIPWYFCKNSEFLTTVSWGAGVKIINNEAFHGCKKLKTLPALTNVESIGNTAFAECKALTEINLGNRLTKIGSRVFAGSKRIKKITIPGTVSLIGGRITEDTGANLIVSFENTNGWLKHSTLKDAEAGINGRPVDFSNEASNAELLSKKAFYSCASPKKQHVDGDICKPSGAAPIKNTDLNKVETSKEAVSTDTAVEPSIKATPSISSAPKVVSATETAIVKAVNENQAGDFEIQGTVLTKYVGKESVVVIPCGVTSVGEQSFRNCTSLQTVTIPNGVTSIGEFAFLGCESLTNVTIGNSVTSIGEFAFSGCKSLTNVTIGNSVTSIGYKAFDGCTKLANITIPTSVKSMSQKIFGSSTGYTFTIVTVPGSAADRFAQRNGVKVTYKSDFSLRVAPTANRVEPIVTREANATLNAIPEPIGPVDKNAACYQKGKKLYNAEQYAEALKEFECVESDYLDVANLRAECRIKLEEEKSNSNAYDSGKSLYESGKYQEALTAWAILSDTYRDVKTMRENCRQQLAGMASVTISTASTSSASNTAIPKTSKYSSKPKISKTTKIAIGVGVVLTIIAIIIFSVIHANSDESLYAWEELSDGTIQINGIEDGKAEKLIKDGVLTIPSEIDGKRVTVISGNSYLDNDYEGATKIVVPEGVVTIGEYAFGGYWENDAECVTEIVLPSTLKHINDNAFKNCDLETVILPSGLKTIGANAFYNCKMSSVSIPGGVTQIGDAAFYGCDNLTSISITNGVEVVGKEAFAYCNSLSKVTLGNTIKTLEQGAFKSIPASTIDLPASLTTIGDSVFKYCNNLSIVMPDNLVNVGKRAFDVKSVKFNKNVKTFDIEWFDSWSIPLITVDSSNKYLYTIDGVLYDYNKTIAYVATDKTITNINLPNTLKTISDECFRGCKNLITIELPDGLTSIGSEAFSNCTAIKELYIPDSVISVGSQILYNCENAIIKCAADEKPSGWSDSFNEYSYKDLKVYWNSGRLSGETNGFVWRTSADGELIIDSYYGNATTVTFPVVEGYTLLKIPSRLFSNHSEIKYLTIPSSVTEIGFAALYGCNGLTSLTLPSVCSVVELFNTSSTYWARVSTPESLKTITFNGGEKIFSSSLYNCTHIENVTIPTTIKSIGTNAFAGCTSLTYVKFASPTGWKYRTYSYTYGESFYQISESSLSSTSNAATLLKDTYDSYEWRKD